MRLFSCRFDGFWPVGAAAVVVAEGLEQAKSLMDSALRERGLRSSSQDDWEEISLFEPKATILCDGNY